MLCRAEWSKVCDPKVWARHVHFIAVFCSAFADGRQVHCQRISEERQGPCVSRLPRLRLVRPGAAPRPWEFHQRFTGMSTLDVAGQVAEECSGLLGAKARDLTLALRDTQPTQQLDSTPCVHGTPPPETTMILPQSSGDSTCNGVDLPTGADAWVPWRTRLHLQKCVLLLVGGGIPIPDCRTQNPMLTQVGRGVSCNTLLNKDLGGAAGGTRTPDRRIRNPMLCPPELPPRVGPFGMMKPPPLAAQRRTPVVLGAAGTSLQTEAGRPLRIYHEYNGPAPPSQEKTQRSARLATGTGERTPSGQESVGRRSSPTV